MAKKVFVVREGRKIVAVFINEEAANDCVDENENRTVDDAQLLSEWNPDENDESVESDLDDDLELPDDDDDDVLDAFEGVEDDADNDPYGD
jgi:hypothetical protein